MAIGVVVFGSAGDPVGPDASGVITGFYERIVPKVQATTATLKDTNRFVLQLQGWFF